MKNDPLVFTAASDRAFLTFITCDDRTTGPTGFNDLELQGNRISLSIDDLFIVRADVFNKPANRIDWASRPAAYDLTDDTCYAGSQVQSVFRRNSAPLGTTKLPFSENFEGSPKTNKWIVSDASFGNPVSPDIDPNKELLLANMTRQDENFEIVNTCSLARVKVTGLAAGSDYVVDFVWRVDYRDDPTSQDNAVLTVVIEP